jgi:matrix metalloproteinase-14 (membrane-inserted)
MRAQKFQCLGDKYWKFSNMQPLPGYPKSIQAGFPGIPANLDAAFVWSGNGKIYFFKGEKFWKFDYDSRPFIR